MKIKTKLLIASAIPCVAISVFGARKIASNVGHIQEMNRTEKLTDFSMTVSNFVHEAQKERGLTAGYLGSKDQSMKSKLLKQYEQTDIKAADLRETYSDYASGLNSQFTNEIDAAMSRLDRLAEIRSAVTVHSIAMPDAIGYYTDNHTALLNVIASSTKQSANAEINSRLMAYSNFLKGKERAGIERAVLSATFGNDAFAPGMYEKLQKLIAEQDAYYSEFEILADSEALALYSQATRQAAFGSADQMRNVAIAKHAEGGFGIDGGVWFDTMTQKINHLKSAEDGLSKNLSEFAASQKAGAMVALIIASILTSATLLVTVVLMGVVIRSIVQPVRRFDGAARLLAEGQAVDNVDVDTNDELGDLARAMNLFFAKLREMRRESEAAAAREEQARIEKQQRDEEEAAREEKARIEEQKRAEAEAAREEQARIEKQQREEKARIEEQKRAETEAAREQQVRLKEQQRAQELSELLSRVGEGANQVDSGTRQIAQTSQQLSEGATTQAASLQQISASLEEISSQTRQNAEYAQEASTLSADSQNAAGQGAEEVSAMNLAMNEIRQSSSQISSIIKVIDEIAFQTNLLALNAAVEAARAGEAGKGFAVVADEVRGLAMRSAEAAKNTAAMIEESTVRADRGVEIAERLNEALGGIVSSTSKVHSILNDISSASDEQAQGVSQINQGVSELDRLTQQNAANSEELASAAQESASQVGVLRGLVSNHTDEESAQAA